MASLFQIRRGATTGSLSNGELYYNQTSQSLQLGSNTGSIITLAKLNETNNGNFDITGNLIVSGNTTIIGNLQFGSTSSIDTVTLLSEVSSSMIPYLHNTFDLGFSGSGTDKYWKTAYISSITGSLSGSISGIGNVTAFSQSVDSRLDYLEGPFSTSVDSRVNLLENAMSGSNRLYVSPSGSDGYDGKDPSTPFRTIKAAVESLGSAVFTNRQPYTIFVGSGEYTEQNPIALPPGVTIVGDTLRTVRLYADNPEKDYFHCHDGNYFYGLRFLNLRNPAFAFSFPCSTATATISGGGGVSGLTMIHTESGYVNGESVNVIIEGPDTGSGVTATATAIVSGGTLSITMVNTGSGYVAGEKPHISIQAPTTKRPIIGTSPYIQNCSSITGPFTTDGTLLSLVPGTANYAQLPYNINDVRNQSGSVIGSGVIDEQGAGGGIRIDGNLVHPSSPLESFVADAFTQVNQGGPGHLVINKGYAQFVSCFTTFCTYGFKVANGGFANISNSVIDFGKKGLISKTYYPQTYNTALANETKYSSVTGFEITNNGGAGYTGSVAGVTLSGPNIPGGTPASASAVVSVLGTISSVYITNSGSGYTDVPSVTIDQPTGVGTNITATANAFISGVRQMKMILSNTTQSVEISSNMILDGENYLVTNVETGSNTTEKLITTFPNPPQIVSGSNVYFHKLSNISTGGLVMEYVGSGVTYNALPKFGGVPDRTKEINEFAPGRIFYSTVDNIGNLKIGEYFAVDQLTGEVTIDARNFNLSGINQIGPFRRNGISVGKVLREVSDSVTLVNSQGVVDNETVPTQYAVFGYVNNYTSSANDRLDDLESTASNHEGRVDILEASQSAFDAAVELTGSSVTIKGDLRVIGTQTTIQSTTLDVVDKNITLAIGSISASDANGAGIHIAGADVTMSWNQTNQRIELNKDFAVTGSISSSTIVGIGNVSLYSTSVNSRLVELESTGSNFDGRLDSIETYTASVSTSVGLLQTFSASQYINDSSSFDSRTDLLETTASYLNTTFSTSVDSRLDALETDSGSQESRIVALEQHSSSVNTYTASVSTSVGLLQQFSGSEYNADSSSFNTRISASTLTFNDTTGQTAIDFTNVGTQVSAIASGLSTGSNVQFNNITASGYISSSKTIYCDTLVANTLTTSGSAVNSFTTNGTFGSVIIKDSGSKAIKALDNANFDDSTFSITGSFKVSGSISGSSISAANIITNDITASGNLFVSGTIYTYELHTIIESSSIIRTSGSTFIGDAQNDVLTITGSLYQTGSTSFSELTGSLFAFSSSLNTRINAATNEIQFATTASLEIVSASAWGAFQSASSYSASFYTNLNTLGGNVITAQNSANGAYASASAYSGSSYTRDANQDTNITNASASAWGAFQSASSYSGSIYTTINTVIANVTTAQNSANGAYASASAYSASAATTYAKLGVENTFTQNQIISGSLNVTGDVIAYATSDERLKDNIQLISNPIEKINQLRGVEFDWKDGMPKAGQHDYGVIAQDVLNVMPELVNQRQDGYYAVDYDKIIGLLIEVVKEQEKRIKELENKVGS